MPAEFLKCPSCGNRVDEDPTTDDTYGVQALAKTLRPAEVAVLVAFCPHCGTVLGVIPQP